LYGTLSLNFELLFVGRVRIAAPFTSTSPVFLKKVKKKFDGVTVPVYSVPVMKTNMFPPIPTATDWSKLDQIRDDIRRNREELARTKAKLDNMGLEAMQRTIDRHRQFQSQRSGPIGWLYRWLQTGSGR